MIEQNDIEQGQEQGEMGGEETDEKNFLYEDNPENEQVESGE